ncbi:hypothetical protein [Lusitaniella coriacea]|uniref:hypothetical protein n=1 Tax=Lusitaniella coriacea TaxID=1983105 RepID=UPI003CF33AFA
MKSHWLLSGLLVFLASCQTTSPTATPSSSILSPDTVTMKEQPAAAETPSPSTSETHTISAEGIGEARVGMTLGELKQKLAQKADFGEEIPLMVDFNAIAVSQNGEIQYYILSFASEPLTDSDPIPFLMTNNPKYLTEEGIGPSVAIAKAEEAYGKATLNYNTDNESREYIQFANPPADNLSFRSDGSSEDFVGIYGESTDGSYYETTEYKEDATIESVMVDGVRP